MKVLVCGGRDYDDPAFVFWVLEMLNARKPIKLVIHGAARGADTFAQDWSEQKSGRTTFCVPADWGKHGTRAGPIRNARMLELGKPDLVVAFDGGAGTRDMTARAVSAGVKVMFAEKLRAHYDVALQGSIDSTLAL
jgi:hypothetical protein